MPSKREKLLLILLIIFWLAAAVQLTYFIIFLVTFKKNRPARDVQPEGVSIIVCAHDEEENLRELIPILLSQEYENFEVIIVNDRSNDNTYDLLLSETQKHPRLKMVNVKDTPDHVNSKKYALTLGIRAAAFEWILLTDADCRPNSPQWVNTMAAKTDPAAKFVLGFSPYLEAPGFLNLFIRFESLITAMQYLSFASLGSPYMGVGRNLAYRKSLFLEKKGFNNYLHVLGGDDDLFVNQHATGKNTRWQISSSSLVYSIPEESWTSFFYQKVRHLSVGKRYKFRHKFLIGVFHATWIVTWFVGLSLLPFTELYYTVIGALVLRWLFMILSIGSITRKAGLGFTLWAVPVLDFLFPIYYLSTGLVTLFTRKVRWKK